MIKQDESCENGIQTSISERLQSYMDTLQFFDDSIDAYIYIYDMTRERLYLTDKIREKFPFPPAGEDGNQFSDWINMVYKKDRKFMDHYREMLISGEISSFNITYRIFNREGQKVWVDVTGTIRENVQSLLLVGRVTEIGVGRIVDGLTGLYGPEKFTEDMNQNLKTSDGYLLVLGVDNFKNINLTQGRAFGDSILKQVAETLDRHTEYPMSLYRLDGDCFGVAFPGQREEDVTAFYQTVYEELKHLCSISAGVVAYKCGEGLDSRTIYQYVENALDQAKREGKARMIFFSEDYYQKNLEQVELLDEMRGCIREGCKGFSLLYQPQISSWDYQIYGAEALLRFDSPTRGRVGPVEFIPLLEESGLICPVGEWILKTAVRQCKAWRERKPDFHISVNMSYVQLQQEGIADTVLNIVKEAGVPGEALTLEVTESIQLQNYSRYNKIFYTWKQYGIKISIDDFGTGYSSLSYLKSIEIDEVKIDRCFVDRIQHNAYNYRLLSNMIELAHSARIEVCCEGVETVEELMTLQELHTDLLQGYLFAKPCTAGEIEGIYFDAQSEAYQDRKAREAKFLQMSASESGELLERLQKEEIGSIIESMEELVYVSDLETHELYYMNAVGRRITGVYDYKGGKCYQVLQGMDHPCEFCTNCKLCEEEFYVWEKENTFLNRHYILKDKLIPWQGKIARLEIAIDVTEKEIVSQAIQKKLDFEQAIVKSYQALASGHDRESITMDAMQIIGEFCKSDRAYVLRPKVSSELWDVDCEWLAPGTASIRDQFPMTQEQVMALGDGQTTVTPILQGGHAIGLVCVDHSRNQEDMDIASMIAYFLGYMMISAEKQVKITQLLESRLEEILSHTDLGLWMIRMDPKTGACELYPDRVLCRIIDMEESMTPEESYRYWYDGVKDEYYDYVNQQMEKMVHSGEIVHLEYLWHFPTKGDVPTRCVGVRRQDIDGMICLEGYHWVVS